MKKDKKVLVATSAADLHLSIRPPVFRSCEIDWLGVQRGYLRQLRRCCAQQRSWGKQSVPCLLCGDIFHKAKEPHEVVNLAIRELPERCYGIAGNHDLPDHRLEAMHRSAYGVLKESGRLIDLEPGKPIIVEEDIHAPIRLHGFPCGHPLEPLQETNDFFIEIAVVHDFIYTASTGYVGAAEEKRLKAYKSKMAGYDICLFGDNHSGFHFIPPEDSGYRCQVFNHGTFMIRRSDERDYEPMIGLIYSDGSVEPYYLDVSQDNYLDEDDDAIKSLEDLDSDGLVDELLALGEQALDFAAYLRRLAERSGVPRRVKDLILSALQQGER